MRPKDPLPREWEREWPGGGVTGDSPGNADLGRGAVEAAGIMWDGMLFGRVAGTEGDGN
jgi:hypothetical protein